MPHKQKWSCFLYGSAVLPFWTKQLTSLSLSDHQSSIFFRSPSLILHIHSKCVKSAHLSPLLTICMLSSSSYIQTDLIPLIWQHLSLSCCRLLSLWEMRFYLFISFSFFCADFLWYLYVVLVLFLSFLLLYWGLEET